MERERARFTAANPNSAKLGSDAKRSLVGGVPMHWMADWPTPFPLFVAHAKGARFTDADGHDYVDFCLGDTGTMFGHAPDAVASAIREQSGRGYTTMLPGEDAVWVGEELARRFGLPFWQMTATATDANTVVVDFKIPSPRFFMFMSYKYDIGVYIVPKHIFEGQDWTTFKHFDIAKGMPVTTGPWRVTAASPQQKVFDRRASWWAADRGLAPLPAVFRNIWLPPAGEQQTA